MRAALFVSLLVGFAGGCQPAPPAPSPPGDAASERPPPVHVAPSDATPPEPEADPSEMGPAAGTPRRLADDDALREGLVEMEGIVRPTKGGLDVRGVTFALETLQGVLPPKQRSLHYDDLLGTKLRVVAELEAHHAEPPSDGDLAIQTRGGDWFAARSVRAAAVVAPAVVIEGTVARSKGLLVVGDHLVTREDLAWSLRVGDPVGKRVRLWGQPRVHRCAPQAQCLVGGSIPMFDVGRGELVD